MGGLYKIWIDFQKKFKSICRTLYRVKYMFGENFLTIVSFVWTLFSKIPKQYFSCFLYTNTKVFDM